MKRARVIPVLLMQNKGLYKTVRFDQPKYVGDPINAVKIFNEKQCDELILLDIFSSKQNKGIDYTTVSEIASECFMPLAYGGGITESVHIERLLKSGVEKVILNSVLFSNPSFVTEAVRNFGSSTIVASVDVKKNLLGKYQLYSHSRQDTQGTALVRFLSWLDEQGVGEVMMNSVDLDGTMKGYDTQLASLATSHLSMPVVLCGGCRDFNDLSAALQTTNISAAASGSFFVFHGPHRAVLISYPSSGQIESIYKSLNND